MPGEVAHKLLSGAKFILRKCDAGEPVSLSGEKGGSVLRGHGDRRNLARFSRRIGYHHQRYIAPPDG